MTAARKFLFDTEFGSPAEPVAAKAPAPPPPPPEPTYSAEDLAAARAAAWADGRAVGEAEAQAETERLLAESLGLVAQRLGTIDAALEAMGAEAARAGIETGVAVARRLVSAVLRRHPEIEIETLFRACLGDLADEPRIVVRVADPLLDMLSTRLSQTAVRSGFGGKVIVIGDEQLDLGDCRIEWADGGAERKGAALWQAVDEIVARHLAPPTQEDDPGAGTGASPNHPSDGETHGR